MKMIDKEFCQSVPKCELHAHLSGSLSASTLKKLLHQHKQTWPDEDLPIDAENIIEGQTSMDGLDFTIFSVIQNITDNPQAIRTATYDVIRDFMNDNVKYLEIRSTPRAVDNRMTKREYCESVLSEIQAAKESGLDIIVTYMLSVDRRKIEQFDDTVELYFEMKEKYPDLVSGIDISGDPRVNDIIPLISKFKELRSKGVKFSIHLAEVLNVEETMEVIKYRPDRIGHGTFIHPMTGGSIQLLQELVESKTPVEVCLTSNVVCKTSKSYEEHHTKYLYQDGVPVVICTDDKGIFACSLSDEYHKAMQYFGWKRLEIYQLSLNSIEYLFTNDSIKSELRQRWETWKEQNSRLFV